MTLIRIQRIDNCKEETLLTLLLPGFLLIRDLSGLQNPEGLNDSPSKN
jgi:hypothetical protein